MAFRTATGVEGDRNKAIIRGELDSSFKEGRDLFCKEAKEITPPPEFDFVEDLFDRIFIAKKGPPFIPLSKGGADSLFRGKELEFLEIFPTRKAKALFLEFEKLITGGTDAGIKESQEGLPIAGKHVL